MYLVSLDVGASGVKTVLLSSTGLSFGVRAGHTRAHLVQAVLEGGAFSFRDCLEAIRCNRIRVGEIRATGGGTQPALRTRIMASAAGRPVASAGARTGGASFGAATRAGPQACIPCRKTRTGGSRSSETKEAEWRTKRRM